MLRLIKFLVPALLLTVLISSCTSLPDQTKYIPKDAMVVLGIHTGAMRKELAWNAVTGSKLLDEMKDNDAMNAPELLKDIEQSGIEFGSVLYFFTKPDKRFQNEMQTMIVVPIADKSKLKAFIQKHFPKNTPQQNDGKEAVFVKDNTLLSWSDDVLLVMNTIVTRKEVQHPATVDTVGGEAWPIEAYTSTEEATDKSASLAEMALAFKAEKANSIAENSRFKELETNGHDISFWLSYDGLSQTIGNDQGIGAMGAGMLNMLWSKSAMAVGVNFEKGKIDAQMKYYASDSMMNVAKEFGSAKVDNELLQRLPSTNLNAALGYHLSPKALRMTLDKIGLLGVANLALMQKGMSVDDVLGAFSGDIVAAVNNFKVERTLQEIDSATQAEYGMTPYPVTTPKMDYVVALKMGDKAKMDKLLSLMVEMDWLFQKAPNTYSLGSDDAKFTLMKGSDYLVAAASPEQAQSFLSAKTAKGAEAVKSRISGHTMGMWADVHSFVEAASPLIVGSGSDSTFLAAVRSLFSTAYLNGGAFKGGANEYQFSLGFINKQENSLVQLLHFAQQLTAANKSGQAQEKFTP